MLLTCTFKKFCYISVAELFIFDNLNIILNLYRYYRKLGINSITMYIYPMFDKNSLI